MTNLARQTAVLHGPETGQDRLLNPPWPPEDYMLTDEDKQWITALVESRVQDHRDELDRAAQDEREMAAERREWSLSAKSRAGLNRPRKT